MLVKRVIVHQNDDKSLEISFEMNGDFEPTAAAFIDISENETENLSYTDPPEEYYNSILGIDVS